MNNYNAREGTVDNIAYSLIHGILNALIIGMYHQMTKRLAVVSASFALAIALVLPLSASANAYPPPAAGLTQAQTDAIVGLLQSFGADQDVIRNVRATLGGTPSDSESFSCNAFADLHYGSFDNVPGGRVSQLQTFLGIPSSTFGFGTYGLRTQAAWNARCSTPPNPVQPSLSYSLIIKAGDDGDSWPESSDLDGLVLQIKNTSGLTQRITLPTNWWYPCRLYKQTTGSLVFDLASVQHCIKAGSAPATTFTLAPGDTKNVEFAHRDDTFHIPPGNYVMKVDVLSTFPLTNAAQLRFGIWSGQHSATIDSSSLTTSSNYPTITGTAKNAPYLSFSVYGSNGEKSAYNSGLTVSVVNGKWSTKPLSYLPPGTYTVKVSDTAKGNLLTGGTLTVTTTVSTQSVTFSSVSSGKVIGSYANLPANSQIRFVNTSTGQRYDAQSTMVWSGGSGSLNIPIPSDLPGGIYYLRVTDYYNPNTTIARSGSFEAGTDVQTNPVAINSFTASPTSVTSGKAVLFIWSSNLTDTDISHYGGGCSIEGLTQNNAALQVTPGFVSGGSVTYVPPATATYTLTCSSGGKDGSPVDTEQVKVPVY